MAGIEYKQRLDPQMVAVLEKQAQIQPDARKVHELEPDAARLQYSAGRSFWNADAPPVDEIVDTRVPGPVGDIPLRIYRPVDRRPLPALVYLHGGGWVVGNLDSHDKIMRRLALASGAAVVGVDYRLAPEHKFPVAFEECLAAVEQVRDAGAQWGLDGRRLALGGDSAGANLSVGVAVELQRRDPSLLAMLLLVYGVFGLRDSPSRRLYGERPDCLSNQNMDYYYGCYLRDASDWDDARFDVLAADLRGLPSSFIVAAGMDLLLDDSIAMQSLMESAGVDTHLEIYEGVLHGFLHYSRTLEASGKAIDAAAAAVRRAFEPRDAKAS
ncbi:MAG: alpha/beta hydrolase fold domain-containing protein [Gammaproteobacteria bacterium]|nr:alpha/beta hydrolase fold domain-containing protein [Gammaproteobacteria bacterium]